MTRNVKDARSRQNLDNPGMRSPSLRFSHGARMFLPGTVSPNRKGKGYHPVSIRDGSELQPVLSRCGTWLRKAAQSAGNVIRVCWNMITKTLPRKSATSLASLLMGMVGRLVRFEQKFVNAESSAQTATESTPSSNKDTTRTKTFKSKLGSSPQGISLTYDNPHEFLHDVTRGELHPRNVTLEQWLIASSYAMIDQKLPDLELALVLGGNVFSLHHCIHSVHFPNLVKPIMENKH